MTTDTVMQLTGRALQIIVDNISCMHWNFSQTMLFDKDFFNKPPDCLVAALPANLKPGFIILIN